MHVLGLFALLACRPTPDLTPLPNPPEPTPPVEPVAEPVIEPAAPVDPNRVCTADSDCFAVHACCPGCCSTATPMNAAARTAKEDLCARKECSPPKDCGKYDCPDPGADAVVCRAGQCAFATP
jgi:hypothetical protein